MKSENAILGHVGEGASIPQYHVTVLCNDPKTSEIEVN